MDLGHCGVWEDRQVRRESSKVRMPMTAPSISPTPTGLLVVELELESWGPAQNRLLTRLPSEDQSRILRYRRDADRERALVAALLPRLLIAQRSSQPFSQPLSAIRFDRSPSGKPSYPGDPSFHFNLSHSGRYVALAVACNPVGVDVEQLRPTLDWAAIAKRFFAADEQRWLAGLDDATHQRRFIALWSRKESLLKATGEGVAGGLSRFSAIADDDVEIEVTHRGRRWFLRSYSILPYYGLALCCGSAGLPEPLLTQARASMLISDTASAVAALARRLADVPECETEWLAANARAP
ncbi:4'-phosphopantetheinyl transferase family protein [Halochromatium sp.]